MTQTATYTEQQFIQDVKEAFASTPDARTQAHKIAQHMQRMLAVPGWPESSIRAQGGGQPGSYILHKDEEQGHPAPGFVLLAYISEPRKPTDFQPPHDHGAAFVVYGISSGGTIQTRYRWEYSDNLEEQPDLKAWQEVDQDPGMAAYFLPGEIHNTQRRIDQPTVYVRLTSQDLGEIWRHRYDPRTFSSHGFKSPDGPRQ